MTQLTVTDDQIRRAFERRAAVNLPSDLRQLVMAAVAAEPQRWSWSARAAEVLTQPNRRLAIQAMVAVALLLAATMAIALIGGPEPLPQGSGGRLVFISGGNLYAATPAGDTARLVWDPPGAPPMSRPTWVDDELVLVELETAGVFAVDLVTMNARLIADGGRLLAISPDRGRVAIRRENDGAPRMSIFDITSGVRLADFSAARMGVSPHSWSPDGRWLIGEAQRESASGTRGAIYRLDVETGELVDIATDLCCGLNEPRPVLSPDGSIVAFVAWHQRGRDRFDVCQFRCGSIAALDPETGGRHPLTSEDGRVSDFGPVFSPDGAWIAFARTDFGATYLAVVRPDGTGERQLTSGGEVFASSFNFEPFKSISWDADSRGLTFLKWPDGNRLATEHELWHITLDGLVERRLGTLLVSEFARQGLS